MPVLEWLFWLSWALVAYTYLLFPLILAVLARTCGRYPGREGLPDIPDSELPRVAMIVAAYNEDQVIESKIQNALALDYPRDKLEILVGSDGSSDKTGALLRGFREPWLRTFVFDMRRGKISVVNDLVSRTNAEIVILSDASTMYMPDVIRKLMRHFRNPKVGCVEGRLLLADGGGDAGEGAYIRYDSWIKRNESRLGCLTGCTGRAMAMRRELFEKLPASTINDDQELTLSIVRRHYYAVTDPDAVVYDAPCAGVRGEMARKARIGAGALQTIRHTRSLLHPRHGVRAFAYMGHKVLRWLVPFFVLAAGLVNLGLLGHPMYRIAFALQLGGLGVALYASHQPEGRSLPKLLKPISYFYLMNIALMRGFVGYWSGRQSVRWVRPSCANESLLDLSVAVAHTMGGAPAHTPAVQTGREAL